MPYIQISELTHRAIKKAANNHLDDKDTIYKDGEILIWVDNEVAAHMIANVAFANPGLEINTDKDGVLVSEVLDKLILKTCLGKTV